MKSIGQVGKPVAPENDAQHRSPKGARKKERKPRAVPGVGQDLKTKAQVILQGQNHHKNRRKAVILNQWIEVEVENGQTITKLYPSNEKLIEEGKTMLPPPDMVYRRLNFPAGVPSEYYWASHDPDSRKLGGTGIQRMTVETWLHVIERENAEGTGLIGPTGIGTLQRPEENGVCECQVCTRITATSETRILDEPD